MKLISSHKPAPRDKLSVRLEALAYLEEIELDRKERAAKLHRKSLLRIQDAERAERKAKREAKRQAKRNQSQREACRTEPSVRQVTMLYTSAQSIRRLPPGRVVKEPSGKLVWMVEEQALAA